MPAIDIREGACVQLVGGSYDDERVRLPDPVGVARHWVSLGFTRLHVVDLDAASDRGSNRDTVVEIIKGATSAGDAVESQVGGGVNTVETMRTFLRAGAARLIVGTRAVEQLDWLRMVTQTFPRRLIVAADVRGRSVVTRGWRYDSNRDVLDVIADIRHLPLAGIMVTAVHKEGTMLGPDLALIDELLEGCSMPLYVAGGIGCMEDLRSLADSGVAAAIVGMALYTGALDGAAVAAEFGGVAAGGNGGGGVAA